MESALKNWVLHEGASDMAVQDAIAALGRALPGDYVDFMRRHDGGEGFVGARYLILWRIAELLPFNNDYEVEIDAPGLLLFGSTGGGEGYGFDTRVSTMPIVRVPFIGMSWRYARPIASHFGELFKRLADQT